MLSIDHILTANGKSQLDGPKAIPCDGNHVETGIYFKNKKGGENDLLVIKINNSDVLTVEPDDYSTLVSYMSQFISPFFNAPPGHYIMIEVIDLIERVQHEHPPVTEKVT